MPCDTYAEYLEKNQHNSVAVRLRLAKKIPIQKIGIFLVEFLKLFSPISEGLKAGAAWKTLAFQKRCSGAGR